MNIKARTKAKAFVTPDEYFTAYAHALGEDSANKEYQAIKIAHKLHVAAIVRPEGPGLLQSMTYTDSASYLHGHFSRVCERLAAAKNPQQAVEHFAGQIKSLGRVSWSDLHTLFGNHNGYILDVFAPLGEESPLISGMFNIFGLNVREVIEAFKTRTADRYNVGWLGDCGFSREFLDRISTAPGWGVFQKNSSIFPARFKDKVGIMELAFARPGLIGAFVKHGHATLKNIAEFTEPKFSEDQYKQLLQTKNIASLLNSFFPSTTLRRFSPEAIIYAAENFTEPGKELNHCATLPARIAAQTYPELLKPTQMKR